MFPNWDLAHWGAERCHATNLLRDISLTVGNVSVTIIRGDVSSAPTDTQPDAYVFFAGSQLEFMDWVRNFQAWGVKDGENPGHICHGFREMYKLARPKVIERLRKFSNVTLFAHSQGYPLSCQLAEDLTRLGIKVNENTSFGGPRWCDKERADAYDSLLIPTRRIVVGWDAVVRWPKGKAEHAGKMFCLSEDGKDLKSQQRPPLFKPWEYVIDFATDHYIHPKYIRALDLRRKMV